MGNSWASDVAGKHNKITLKNIRLDHRVRLPNDADEGLFILESEIMACLLRHIWLK